MKSPFKGAGSLSVGIIIVLLIAIGIVSYSQLIKSEKQEKTIATNITPTPSTTPTPTLIPSPTTIPTPTPTLTPTPTVTLYQTQEISPYPTPTVYVYPTPVVYPLPLPIPIPVDFFTYWYYGLIYGTFDLMNATINESFNLVNTVIDYQFGVLNNAIDETRFFLRNAFPILTDPQKRQQLLLERQRSRQERLEQFYNRPKPTIRLPQRDNNFKIQRNRDIQTERDRNFFERFRTNQ